jgi:hypothetical protein
MLSIDKRERSGSTDIMKILGRRSLVRVCTLTLCALALLLAGCRQDMHNQPKYRPLRSSDFFADGQASRPLVAGTVARGDLREDWRFYTGKISKGAGPASVSGTVSQPPDARAVSGTSGQPVQRLRGYLEVFPFPITPQVLDRGQDRYNAFCTPCHDRVGTGQGMVVRRGYRRPPSFHIDRLREAPVGYFFDVITNGFGAMPDYAAQIPPQDRWAIIAFLRALQLSQQAPLTFLPESERQKLKAGGQTP